MFTSKTNVIRATIAAYAQHLMNSFLLPGRAKKRLTNKLHYGLMKIVNPKYCQGKSSFNQKREICAGKIRFLQNITGKVKCNCFYDLHCNFFKKISAVIKLRMSLLVY